MEKDKVESRTPMNDCPKCGGTHFGERKGNCPLSADYVADKPWPKPVPDEVIYSSVPDAARPSVPPARQAHPIACCWCGQGDENHETCRIAVEWERNKFALADSRSEVATPQVSVGIICGDCLENRVLKAGDSCGRCANKLRAGAPAAGSTERQALIKIRQIACTMYPADKEIRAIVEYALAGD